MLENIERCPMCDSARQHQRFESVPDFVFGATSELWTINECAECESLFLATRPDSASIGRYYERYYTHANEADVASISGISIKSGLAKRLANSWRNHKYGSQRPSLGILGTAAAYAISPLRSWINAESRHIPTFKEGGGSLKVLDVGHGDARFLRFVREIGHTAAGVEIDPKAVAQAQDDGLDVHQGGIELALQVWGKGYFDYITMSHVIEHVHSPRQTIAIAAELLKPGGCIWIECPNPSAQGLAIYGARWRDLDPPRHLCIPSLASLRTLASAHGLEFAALHWRPFVPFEVFPFSAKANGESPLSSYRKAVRAEWNNIANTENREWLTVSFTKSIA